MSKAAEDGSVEAELVEGDEGSHLVAVTGHAIEDARADIVNQKDADAVRVRVRQLRDQMSNGYFEIGRLLYRVNRQGLWTQWRAPDGTQYDSFKSYIEHEVEFAFRKAKSLMSIWWWFTEEVKDPTLADRIREIGWTKAAMLVGVANKNNADAWIDKARQLSATQLGDETKKALERSGASRRPARPSGGQVDHVEDAGSDESRTESDVTEVVAKPATSLHQDEATTPDPIMGDLSSPLPRQPGADPLTAEEDEETRTKWVVKVNGPQRKNIEAALDEASRIAEVPDGKGYLLDFVATAFLAHHAASGRMPTERQINMRNDILLAVQRALDVDLVVFERGTSHCIFGDKTLERIAAEAGGE